MTGAGAGRATSGSSVSSVAVSRHLVRSALGVTTIGVDAQSVEEIDDVDGVGRLDLAHLYDLTEILRLPRPESWTARRVLVVKVDGRLVGLVVGEIARVEAVPVESLKPLPVFLAAIGARTGIRQVSIDAEGIGFVLDITAVAALLRRST